MMQTTGDKRNAIKKLQNATKLIKYTSVDFKEINIGSPKEYLKLYHYLIVDYNPAIAMEILNKHQMELQGKNDKSFIDSIYKLMRDMLNYKPPITKEQFFSIGYAEIKALMACEVIGLIQQKFKLTSSTVAVKQSAPASKMNENHRVAASSRAAAAVAYLSQPAPNRTPLVHNHRILNTNLPSNIKSSFSSDDIHKNVVMANLTGYRTADENVVRKNTILEVLTNDDECQSEAETVIESPRETDDKYEFLMNELHSLREQVAFQQQQKSGFVNGSDNEQRYIKLPVKDYENLVSRVTLMENKLLIVEQQNHQLLQLLQDKNYIKAPSEQVQPQQKSRISLAVKKAPELAIEDLDEDNDTLYETPFVSFMNDGDEDQDATPTIPASSKQQTRMSLVTKGLLAQGILDESSNELTPTVDTNDTISRARTLEKRASALVEEMKIKT